MFNAAEKENLMILQAGPDVVRLRRAWWWKMRILMKVWIASNVPLKH